MPFALGPLAAPPTSTSRTTTTRATPDLSLQERRAREADARFALAVVLPHINAADGHTANGSLSVGPDPLSAIEETVRSERFDEIILDGQATSHADGRIHELARRVAGLGVPLTVIAEGRTTS
jgi:hypothetical protein